MAFLPALFGGKGKGLLTKPGDKMSARVTKSGRQVVKLDTSEIRRSAVRYPSTGTTVETIVRRIPK